MNNQNFYYKSLGGRLLGSTAREQLILEEMKKLGKKDFFVDIGCAQGHYLHAAKEQGANAFGLEFEKNNIVQVKNAESFGLVNADAQQTPFKSSCFDFVLCSEVLEHVPNWKKGLEELKRIARKKIMITIPLEKSMQWNFFSFFAPMKTRGHLHKLDSQDIEREMKGWKLEKKVLVHTPSIKLNKKLEKRVSEKKAMYSVMVFERQK